MYSLKGLESIFDVLVYTSKAMEESGFSKEEIDQYICEILPENNYAILEISSDYLNQCNSIHNSLHNNSFEDTWRDSYYASLMNDYDLEDNSEADLDSDVYSYLTSKNEVWFDDPDEEAYEGFSSCKNTYWNNRDDETDYWKDTHSHVCDSLNEEQLYDPWNN